MNKDNRPVGREKRVGTGGGSVTRRGSGLGGSTGGPVGNSGGYSDRSSGFNAGGGTSRNRAPGGKPKLLSFVVILIVMYLIITQLGGNNNDTQPQDQGNSTPSSQTLPSTPSQPNNPGNITTDTGAYAPDTTVSDIARTKRTTLQGNGKDTATVMVYMCGTDLESRSGMASSDLNEMLHADISEKVNIIVETGGTQKWQNSVINSSTNQRYRVTPEGLEPLEKNLGKKSMVKPGTLTDFIDFCEAEYPADRYILVFWDHGGGSLSGYGYDQHFQGDSMTLDEIGTALKNAGCNFDIIGFDACLMATLETAMVLEPYADYMVASEETEPGIGWYYTGWISELSKNTSVSTVDLGKKLIDDYIAKVKQDTPRSQGTLSLIDLAELKGTAPTQFKAFARSTGVLLDGEQYHVVSDARSSCKEFSKSSKLNQIDLIDFAKKLETPEAVSLAKTLSGSIKYNRTTNNITNANGLSIYFPYNSLNKMNAMLNTYDKIGLDEEYSECIRSFASMAAGGQIVSNSSGNPLDSLLGMSSQESGSSSSSGSGLVGVLLNSFLSEGDFSSITGSTDGAADWLDLDRIQNAKEYYEENQLDAAALKITKKGGQRVLQLTEQQWKLVQNLELNVFIDDGEGFIDLGLDNVFEYNNDGDLIMEFDGTWVALNDHIVSYYMVSEDRSGDTYSIRGRVPVLLNDQLADIIIVFDNENPYGTVIGAQLRYDTNTETETQAKGLIEILQGDKIDYLCDYYTYDGQYNDTYFLGDAYTATGKWTVENLSVGDDNYQMTYRITDIYNNKYWTPSVTK
ncbi:MAG: peptidase C11 [Thermoclostridium sp.]|nr:peptidase C11 [Thermoclostridium sp.]